jgi:hypothetical protein
MDLQRMPFTPIVTVKLKQSQLSAQIIMFSVDTHQLHGIKVEIILNMQVHLFSASIPDYSGEESY